VTTSSDEQGCIFCSALASGDTDPLVLYRGETCFVILNLYPYNNGHLMIVPNRHLPSLVNLTREELAEMMELARRAEIAVGEAYSPQGMNMGVNLGRSAGAGVVDHLHLHVVPRWTGDTNFMSIFGHVRVMPEELSQTAERLRPIFERLAKASNSDR
jgi:ATP adenylyltransferase